MTTDLAAVLAELLQRVPRDRQPLLIATAERLAADRYRGWAARPEYVAHRDRLLACAAREDDIATRIEAIYGEPATTDPELRRINDELFGDRPVAEQLAVQAGGERLGARTWRSFARHDAAHATEFEACAVLEEQSAEVLESILSAPR